MIPAVTSLLHSADRVRIVVLGYIVRGPLGGFGWHHMQYVSGLAKLGHEVVFVEDSGPHPSCYNPEINTSDSDPSYGLRFIGDAFAACGIGSLWAYHDAPSSRWYGPRSDSILADCARANLLINLCDAEPLPAWLEEIPVRALIDTDPVFSQVRHLSDSGARAAAAQHNVFFSFGENIHAGTAAVPDDGFAWRATRQPIDLDQWPATGGNPTGRWTTIMQWDSYPPIEHAGVLYGTKSHSFEPYFDLPELSNAHIEIAVGSPSAPRELLERKGWHLRNPLEVSRTTHTYRNYIRASKGELAVAKHAYTVSNSGWFSERSACYLASGCPVIVQDTGFSKPIPACGEGLIAFNTIDEAVSGIESVQRDYARHSRAARAIAEEYFDSGKVLPLLIESAMNVS